MSQRVIFWITSFTTCVVLSKKIHHVSNFESKALQSVKFCFMKFKKSQFLSWKLQNVSNCGKSCIQMFTWIILFRKIDMFCPLRAFSKAFFWKKQCALCQNCHEQNQNLSGSALKVLQRVKSWNEKFTNCQVLTWKFQHVS